MRAFAVLALACLGAAPAPSPVEIAVLAEINRVRADPAAYATDLRAYRTHFRGRIVRYPGNPEGLITSEGVRAVDEAIGVMSRQSALPAVSPAPLLAMAARDHVVEQGPRGATGHESRNGDRAAARVARHGGGGYVAEVITYGPPSAAEVVRQLIVDDGVPGRGHRRILLAAEFRHAGVSCGPHKRYRVMCVVVFGRNPDGRP